jgi:malate synthase
VSISYEQQTANPRRGPWSTPRDHVRIGVPVESGPGTTRAVAGLRVDEALYRFVADEALPGSGVEARTFWGGLAALVTRHRERNQALLRRRGELQAAIDGWHRSRRGIPHDPAAYRSFLEHIGYLRPEGPDFEITTRHVDTEIADIAGPQLVVPVTNARYALNAANARWGSLYDALYGTDAIGGTPPDGAYDPERGAQVVAWGREFLDRVAPLDGGSHTDAAGYAVRGGRLEVTSIGGATWYLQQPRRLAGYQGATAAPSSILLRNHGLHVELVIDRDQPVGAAAPAGIADIVIEAAVTTIVDFEDSVATVDADDKVAAYRNWLSLMKGDLVAEFDKHGTTVTRRLADERTFVTPGGSPLVLSGRALLLVRNVGHLMTTGAVRDGDGNEIPEGFLDAMITVLAALHDLRRPSGPINSRAGSVYVVKPKMHGPEEAAFADSIFSDVEAIFGLPTGTVKIGLMDEERRTSLNLKECIRAVRGRIAFINTGFLDRTGDEIHTSMQAGVMVRKAEMRSETWLAAYERHNVDVGLACGLRGRAQIGKGMWAAPDRMAQMLAEKIGHPRAGANCAWVPSPTAATLHATHYHQVAVDRVQACLRGHARTTIDELLALPLAARDYAAGEVAEELENNAQSILGYLVRWIDGGVGCSKVPDIHDVALMEDRATCRISSQHMANWLAHGVVDRDGVLTVMRRMAATVDRQNADDPGYQPMAPDFDGPAFRAACQLVLEGAEQPSGYTEPILHAARLLKKQAP